MNDNDTTQTTGPRRPRGVQMAPRAPQTRSHASPGARTRQNAIWIALAVTLACVAAAAVSVWTLRAQLDPGDRLVCSEYVGPIGSMQYEAGAWIRPNGSVVGYGQFEDSPIMSTAACAGLR